MPDRVLPVRRVLSHRPPLDERLLGLGRWIAERYVVPRSVALAAMHPPRVAAEERRGSAAAVPVRAPRTSSVLERYENGSALLCASAAGSGVFVCRPLPDEEAGACLEAVAACVAGGRSAVVVVPEAEPVPHTARMLLDAFGKGARWFAGGSRAERYGAWLDVLAGRYRLVVGPRAAAVAPVPRLGLIWVARDAHPAHRERRTPRYHSREIALARARLEEAVAVLAGPCPSGAAAALVEDGDADLVRPSRAVERAAGPIVETTQPREEDRSPRLAALLKRARGAFLLASRIGYGIARRCRECGEPARCAECAGPIVLRAGRPICGVCGAAGRCAVCGGGRFGVERGGTERIEEWARRVTRLPVRRVEGPESALEPSAEHVVVGSAAAVKDLGPQRTELVAILDPDRALRRAGVESAEQTLATWMEAAGWAGSRAGNGRVLIQTRDPGDPAVQALVRWDPSHFHRVERRRRSEAGFPPGHPVFRVTGDGTILRALEAVRPVSLLETTSEDDTVCLVTIRPEAVPELRERLVALAEDGVAVRVEAEPQIG